MCKSMEKRDQRQKITGAIDVLRLITFCARSHPPEAYRKRQDFFVSDKFHRNFSYYSASKRNCNINLTNCQKEPENPFANYI